MNNQLDNILQAYRVHSAPSKLSWKQHWVNEEFSSDELMSCSKMERHRFVSRLEEGYIMIAPTIKSLQGEVYPLRDLIQSLFMSDYAGVSKMNRRVVYSTNQPQRPTGKNAFETWNGFQVIDMDIKDQSVAEDLKVHIFNKLKKCNWFLGVALSSSGKGLHIYTKIAIPEEFDKMKLLYLTNFRHKYSFVYIACLDRVEALGYSKTDLQQWMDLAMFKPQQGAFIPYDPKALISTKFFEDFIYICFDHIDEIGHPDVDWVNHPDLKQTFSRWEYFEDQPEDKVNIEVVSAGEANAQNKVHYKHNERWKLANTLVRIYGLQQGYTYLRQIVSNKVSNKELLADCQTSNRHNKDIDLWAVKKLNSDHGFNIKLDVEDHSDMENELYDALTKLENPNIIRRSKHYHKFFINKDQYLGHIVDDIVGRMGRITLLEAGPGLGKTEMVKKLVSSGKKIMMVMPFTSTIKSKVENQDGWYFSYGSKKPKLDVENGLALTIDKFSRLGVMDIAANGFDYIFIDESHLLFMSEYRSVMSTVVDMIRTSEVPVVLMSGTPTGELVFFQDIVHIHVEKEETRKKELYTNLVFDSKSLEYNMCRQMARSIAEGRRVLYPTNAGSRAAHRMASGVQYFLETDHMRYEEMRYKYYKKSEVGEAFMDDINFHKTIKDLDLLMCTSFLSVGVDILDRYEFDIFFDDLYTSAEVDQWANRLRSNDLIIHMYVAKNDAEGNPRFITRYKPMDFRLDEDELKDMHSILRICNSALERNPTMSKYNTIVSSIVHGNQYIKYDEVACKYYVDEISYKTVMFERKYREYTQQLPVLIKGMQSYGYAVHIKDWDGEFVEASWSMYEDWQAERKSQYVRMRLEAVEDLLDHLDSSRLEAYREVMGGRIDLLKGREYVEEVDKVYVPNVEVFEKVIPIFLSLNKTFDVVDVKEIFEFCKTETAYNFAALNRFRVLVNLIQNHKEGRLDLPLVRFMEETKTFVEYGSVPKEEITTFINRFATSYAQEASTLDILVENSPKTMKRLTEAYKLIFNCLVHCSKSDGLIHMSPVEILWRTREDKFTNSGETVYILSEFMDSIIQSETVNLDRDFE